MYVLYVDMICSLSFQVMLWVLASLLALVDGSVAGRDREESLPAILRSSERMAWYPTNHPQAQEEEEETDDPTSWAGLFGECATKRLFSRTNSCQV